MAEGIQVEVLKTSKAVLGPNNPLIQINTAHLAWIYTNHGRWEQAKQLWILLSKKHSDVNARGEHGNTLQAACFRGHWDVVNILVDNGVNINARGGTYDNALQAASLRGHREIAELLLQSGADINAQGGKYGNALQAASFQGHIEIVHFLLEHGADTHA
ncbi:ankyrin repeat-containing domain protein [Nemania sp. FL0031]|nr:ankyrin repeat-containing domain protein [Nemania sp. FL0031]